MTLYLIVNSFYSSSIYFAACYIYNVTIKFISACELKYKKECFIDQMQIFQQQQCGQIHF